MKNRGMHENKEKFLASILPAFGKFSCWRTNLNDCIWESQSETAAEDRLSKRKKDTSDLKGGVKDGFQGSLQEGGCEGNCAQGRCGGCRCYIDSLM